MKRPLVRTLSMKNQVKARRRCRTGTKFAGSCCVDHKAEVTLGLRPSVSAAVSELASRLRLRQRMIREAVAVAQEITGER
jgi:hypothetical protein